MDEQLVPAARGTAGHLRVSVDDPSASALVTRHLIALLEPFRQVGKRGIAVVCIGTDRSTGDALGPLVGSMLEEMGRGSATVYGTLDEPVHATNIVQVLNRIQGRFGAILAVDACLGRLDNVGTVSVGLGPLQPGAGVHKDLPAVGDLYITGTVNVGGLMEYFVLQNTRLSLVMRMARVIAAGVHPVILGERAAAASGDND